MNRPRGGNFIYTDAEFAEMVRDVDVAKKRGIDGIVLGLLKKDGIVDVERTKRLVELARPLPVTYHRAFDECMDLKKSLEDVIETGAATLLTSGGKATAPEGVDELRELVRRAGKRLVILPGSGIHGGNIKQMVEKTQASEYHAALSSVVARPAEHLEEFEAAVRALAETLVSCA
jgi:copper homeostasis protein